MTRTTLLTLLLLLSAAPAWAQNADLLAIPESLTRTVPPGQAGSGPLPGVAAQEPVALNGVPNYRAELRSIVGELSAYGRGRNADFIVLARGGADLVTKAPREAAWEALSGADGAVPVGSIERGYIRALDGIVLDGLYCANGQATAAEQRKARLEQLKPLTEMGRRVLSIDTCTAADAVRQAAADKVLQFTAADRRLQAIPGRPPHENANLFTSLTLARNLLVNLRSEPHDTKSEWLMKLKDTNHDILVIDAFHRGSEALTRAEVEALKYKRLGSRRLVLAAMPLTIAAEDRFYWKKEWRPGNPAFLGRQIGDSGEYPVDYWLNDWKKVLGNHFKGIVDLGFDGVMLDGLDVYRKLEDDNPITDEERKAKAQAAKEERARAKAAAQKPPDKPADKKTEPMIGEEVDPSKPAGATPVKTPDKPAAKPADKPQKAEPAKAPAKDKPGPDKLKPKDEPPRPPGPAKP